MVEPSERKISSSLTSFTPALSRTSTEKPFSLERSFSSAASCKSVSKAISTLFDEEHSTSRTKGTSSLYSRGTSCAMKSRSSPHSSTPVGPEPITTKVSSSVRCASVSPGSDACSNVKPSRARKRLASGSDLRKRQCSFTPLTPKVLVDAPTATTNWSYGTSNSRISHCSMPSHTRLAHVTVLASRFTRVASASKYLAVGWASRIGWMIERGSSVPSAAPASIGVKRK
mmetsp:Transcript_2367/g.5905  ORF Transcript_2367/g.5905 Transcript_2367/m.5905 type:complete len:228 (-) Transcript_2367:63-746(-)